VVVQTAGSTTVTAVAALDLASCQIQPMPDGWVLAVGSEVATPESSTPMEKPSGRASYSGFPIVHIADRKVTAWRTQLRGATALVADTDTCAVIMGDQRPRAIVGHLTDGRYEPVGERMLTVAGHPQRTSRLHMIARGSQLHVFDGPVWHLIDLDDLL
jgi:hypothetical protein